MGEGLFGVLPGGWEETTLGDVCRRGGGKIQTGPFGSQLHASDYVPVGIPTVMPANIGDNRIVEDGIARVSESDAQRLARHRLQLGDIVYSRRGDVERRALVRQHEVGWLCGTGSLLVRTGNKFADPVYLSLWLGHPQVRAWITQHAVGATMANLNTEILSDVPVVVPPLAEQRAIAGVLGALDDKIDSNRRIAAQAAELAKTELLAAPAGRTVRLGEVAKVAKGLSYKGDGLADEGVPMVNMGSAANFGWLKRNGFKHYTGAYKTKHIAHPGDVLVVNTEQTWRNEIIGWPMIVPGDVGDVLFTHHIFRADFEQGFTRLRLPYWASLFEPSTRAMLDSMVYGTTVATLPAEALERVEIRVPDYESAIDAANALLERVWEAERETSKLETLRDALLPELLSGRLRVRDAEEIVGSV